MIKLTRLNGKEFTLNALYVELIEEFPDTTITLTSGRKYVVLEKADQVQQSMIDFYKQVQLLGNPHLRGEENEK